MTKESGVTLLGLRSFPNPKAIGLAGLLLAPLGMTNPALAATAGADADIVLKPAGAANLQGLAVGVFAPDSTLSAPVETLQPLQSTPVTALRIALNNNPGLCPDHTIAGIVELPNQEPGAASVDGPDCIFGAQLTLESGAKTFEIATECGVWIDNTATCWGYGQTGEFRLLRQTATSPVAFRLVFPGPGAKRSSPAGKAPPPAQAGDTDASTGIDPAGQKHGLFLDTLLDDKKESKGDVWFVWTGATVELAFAR